MIIFLLIYIAVVTTICLIGVVIAIKKQDPPIFISHESLDLEEVKKHLPNGKVSMMPRFFRKKKRGAIFLPESDLEEARAKIVEENNKKGASTPLTDLYPNDEE